MLAIPIACVARTIVFEEIFREPRDWCKYRSKSCRTIFFRKFYYLFTCEYCFSHWVTLFFLVLSALGPGSGFRLLYDDWRGYVISFFSLIFVSNSYLNLYSRLRVDISSEKAQIEARQKEIEVMEHGLINGHLPARGDGDAARQATTDLIEPAPRPD